MDIILGIAGNVKIEHMAETGDVEAARGDVGGDHQRDFTVLEFLQRFQAGGLRHVSMQRHGAEIMPLQRRHQRADVALAVAEDHRVLHILAFQQPAERFALALRCCPGEMLGDGVGGAGRRRYLDDLGVRDELVAEGLDIVGQGGREEQCLAKRRQQADNALDIRDKAHIEHPVGLVDDENLHICQQHLAALEMVEQPARRGDQHIDPLVESRVLVGKADPADQKRHRQLVIGAEFLEGVGHLRGKLAGRGQDQRPGKARLGASRSEDFDHRKGEGGGLARPRLRGPENVAPHQNIGDGFFLDRSRGGVSQIGYRLAELIAQTKFRKIHQ